MQLSIVIPSYNHERYVLSTIRAAAKIEVRDKEIIVIDDGSTDASTRVIDEYIAAQGGGAGIRLISRENRGLVKTLNEGLSLSRGKYFYAVASDDIPIPAGISSLIEILEKNRDQQFALGNGLFMESEQQREFTLTYGEAHRRFFSLPFDRRHKEMFFDYPQPILIQATVFKKSALSAIGGWREDLVVDDFSLFIRMFSSLKRVGTDFEFRPDIMACFYRRHQANSSNNLARQFMMVEQALAQLCPREWRDAALVRNFAAHGLAALKRGKIVSATHFFRSTVDRVGLFRSINALASESSKVLKRKIFGSRRSGLNSLVFHDPAATIIEQS